MAGRVVDVVDRAVSVAATAMEMNGFPVSADLRTALGHTAGELSRHFTEATGSDRGGPDLDAIRLILEEDRQRFFERLMLLPDGVLARLHNGADLIGDLDWRSV